LCRFKYRPFLLSTPFSFPQDGKQKGARKHNARKCKVLLLNDGSIKGLYTKEWQIFTAL